ncbi:ABC transporter ATP-binding protein [Stenotrophomonas acidaminiphila]|uniref:ABC transporter ATP-binding protein n=1 Tax=Stenotrophomonas TaxID=40323 RepID=UPI0013759AAC|nr:ABC transporter ATP-binding protein [Stenotrophomonas acidaminiphila]NCT88584.1 ABC transporter ATP-binding protein [Stenotrophomonas acidaminiphila]
MSCDDYAVSVEGVGKCYHLYGHPSDRLKQFVLPRLASLAGMAERRYFREFWALRDVGFQVRRGDQVGIVGRNGAGKSTLLQIICGTLAATEGSVRVNGRVAALLELGAGFNPELSGAENVFLNGAVLGLDRQQMEQRYERILAFADIGEFISQPVKNYSSGMYMRLAFAVAAHVDPEILVVDEALSVGDEAFQRKCNLKIQSLRDAGATVLFVSHSASHVIEVCNRALLIDKGRLVCEGEPKKIVSTYHRMIHAAAKLEGEVGPVAATDAEEVAGSGDAVVMPEIAVDDEAFWDPGLVSTTAVDYPSLDCRILSPRLLRLDGRKVNVLAGGGEYVYAYEVHFEAAAAAVRFGMMIRTMRGLDLGGGVSMPAGASHEFFVRGSVVEVRFRFRAAMEAGVYFLNAGVVTILGDEEKYLARIVDAVMFRVLAKRSSLATGMVDFGISPGIKVQEATG